MEKSNMSSKDSRYGEYLYSNYYGEEKRGDSQASSHWSDYSSRFRVEHDDEQIYSLTGYGFGDLQETSIPNKWLTYLCEYTYLITDSKKNEKNELIRIGKKLAGEMDGYFSFDCFRQVYSLNLILKTIKKLNIGDSPHIMIIGDGFGYLACLLKMFVPKSKIVLIDLGKTLFFQYYYSNKVFPKAVFYGIRHSDKQLNDQLYDESDFIFCPADSINLLENLDIDVAVNIHSMQEMTYGSIYGYFNLLRKIMRMPGFFYCCNRERKELVGGEVIEFDRYPWNTEDQILLDEYCPWCRYFFSTAKTKNGLNVLGIRIPFVNYFDGPIRHRIVMMENSD